MAQSHRLPADAVCHYCGGPAATWDHVIPRAMKGPNQIWNMVPSCYRCNHRKARRSYEAFTGRPELPVSCKAKGFATTGEWREKREEWLKRYGGRPKPRPAPHPAWVAPS